MPRFGATTISVLILSCTAAIPAYAGADSWRSLQVSASAYNSVAGQTSAKQPNVTAWGDVLRPGMRAIAVSRDLIRRGLIHGTRVRIEGLPGIYIVRDKMNRRWHRKIDIYMGRDVEAARAWGTREVRIRWQPPGSR